jgi:hypothetical protein
MTSPGPTRRWLEREQAALALVAHAGGMAARASGTAYQGLRNVTTPAGGPGLPKAATSWRRHKATIDRIAERVTSPRRVQRPQRRPAGRDHRGLQGRQPPAAPPARYRSRHSQNARAPPREAKATR